MRDQSWIHSVTFALPHRSVAGSYQRGRQLVGSDVLIIQKAPQRLSMPKCAAPVCQRFDPCRQIACAVAMCHYQFLVTLLQARFQLHFVLSMLTTINIFGTCVDTYALKAGKEPVMCASTSRALHRRLS